MEHAAEVEHVAALVTARYATAAPDMVRELVEDALARYAQARIRSFVAVIAQREVEAELRRRSRADRTSEVRLPSGDRAAHRDTVELRGIEAAPLVDRSSR